MSDLVGVDIGGTKVAVARVHEGELGESLVAPTERTSARALIDQLVRMVDGVRSDAVSAVGIGVPSVIEFETGRVVSSVNVMPALAMEPRNPQTPRILLNVLDPTRLRFSPYG